MYLAIRRYRLYSVGCQHGGPARRGPTREGLGAHCDMAITVKQNMTPSFIDAMREKAFTCVEARQKTYDGIPALILEFEVSRSNIVKYQLLPEKRIPDGPAYLRVRVNNPVCVDGGGEDPLRMFLTDIAVENVSQYYRYLTVTVHSIELSNGTSTMTIKAEGH